jgi:hypothetical protein
MFTKETKCIKLKLYDQLLVRPSQESFPRSDVGHQSVHTSSNLLYYTYYFLLWVHQ